RPDLERRTIVFHRKRALLNHIGIVLVATRNEPFLYLAAILQGEKAADDITFPYLLAVCNRWMPLLDCTKGSDFLPHLVLSPLDIVDALAYLECLGSRNDASDDANGNPVQFQHRSSGGCYRP